MKIYWILIATLGLSTAHAVDLGLQGTAFPIVEPDMRSRIMRDAAQVDFTKLEQERKTATETYFSRLAPYALPVATKTQTQWIDPSLELAADLKTMVKQPNGEYRWVVLYSKGTRINPLENAKPKDRMLFFDGRDPAQVNFVREALKAEPRLVIPVLTAGNPAELGKTWSRPVFFATQVLVDKFQLKETPTLVGIGDGNRALFISVTALAAPYTPELLKAAWSGIQGALK